MKRIATLIALMQLIFVLPASAETLPLTVWQKETRMRPVSGDTLHLNRASFTLVLPLKPGEHLDLLAAEGEGPEILTGFDPGHGMAGPYDGLFLTWDGFHYFLVDADGPRAELWDRELGQYYWKARKLYRNYGSGPAVEIPWSEVKNLTLIVRKEGYEDLTFTIDWVDY